MLLTEGKKRSTLSAVGVGLNYFKYSGCPGTGYGLPGVLRKRGVVVVCVGVYENEIFRDGTV